MHTDKTDKNIGARIRMRRKEQNINLMKLANLLGLSYQQVQKYESGNSKITVDKLLFISHLLNTPIEYFIQDVDVNQLSFGIPISSDIVPPYRMEPMEVMLVEDNPLDISTFQEIALSSNIIKKVRVMHHADDALPFLQNTHHNPNHRLPDMVFLNIAIASVDGLALLKRIKENQELRHIPIIALTESVHKEDLERAYKLGIASYILKRGSVLEQAERLKKIFDYWGNIVALQHM